MTPATDPTVIALTGRLPAILIFATVLALPTSIGLLTLYRRAVLRSMASRTSPQLAAPDNAAAAAGHTPQVEATLSVAAIDMTDKLTMGPEAHTFDAYMRRGAWSAAAIYTVAGWCYALVLAGAFVARLDGGFVPLQLLVPFWSYAWPVVLSANLVVAMTWRTKAALAAVYFLVYVGLCLAALAASSKITWGQLALFWVMTNVPPTLLLYAFLNRRTRAVGPLVLAFMIVAVTGSDLLLAYSGGGDERMRSVVRLGSALGLGGDGTFIALIVVGFVVLGAVGWPVFRWIGRLYQRKKISDQSITVDVVWLVFGIVSALDFAFEGPAWVLAGPLAFVVYKLVSRFGFWLLRNSARRNPISRTLLLLRVFSLGKRSEQLFDALATRWRYAGSIRFIAGPDLATTTVSPHEFLDFLSGKLTRQFIANAAMLEARVAEMDVVPDWDGRFRVSDFFCYDDTWKMVLHRLVTLSDAVLMDLRGFAPRNAGCIFEIDELLNVAPLERVVFIIDDTTDEPFLRQQLQESATRLKPDSPNRRAKGAALNLFRFAGSRAGGLKRLIRALGVAATADADRSAISSAAQDLSQA